MMDSDNEVFYKRRRVLITGGLDFIGSNLAARLVTLGPDVLLVDSDPRQRLENSGSLRLSQTRRCLS